MAPRSTAYPQARGRNYAREYAARKARHRGLPARVAAGKGDVPARIAQKAEAGTLTSEEARRYRAGLRAYEKRFGPAARGRKGYKSPGTRHTLAETFDSESDAYEYAAVELAVSDEFLIVQQRADGRWTLTLLR